MGSLASDRVKDKKRLILFAGVAAAVLAVFVTPLLLSERLLALPTAVSCALAFLAIAPAALPMGMLFPSGLRHLARSERALVAWAYAVNGFAGVVAGSATILLMIAVGIRWSLGIAATVYLAAAFIGSRSNAG